MWKKSLTYTNASKCFYYETEKEYSCSNSYFQFQLAVEKNLRENCTDYVVYIKFQIIKDNDQNINYNINIPTWELIMDSLDTAIKYEHSEQDIQMKLTEHKFITLYRFNSQYDYDNMTVNITVFISKSTNAPPYKNMFEDQKLTDLELVCEDGSVLVHKYVFASCSEVFMKMLNGTWREAKEAKVKIPDATVATLEQLKEFIYLGSMPQENWEPVAELACKYMIQGIEEKLIQMYQKSITIENFCLFKNIVFKHNFSKLFMVLLDSTRLQLIEAQQFHTFILKE